MIQGLEIAGAILAVYFLVGMMFFFRYLYFKKGSWKKSVLHIFISLLLFTIVIMAYMLIGKNESGQPTVNQPASGAAAVPAPAITAEVKDILTKKPEEVNTRELLIIARLSTASLTAEEESQYLDKIKEFYIYQNVSIRRGTKEEMAKKFDEERASVGKK